MYFHTDSPRTARWLSAVLGTAADNEQRIRIDVDDAGRLRVKRGEGIWSAPIESTEDPYRDAPVVTPEDEKWLARHGCD